MDIEKIALGAIEEVNYRIRVDTEESILLWKKFKLSNNPLQNFIYQHSKIYELQKALHNYALLEIFKDENLLKNTNSLIHIIESRCSFYIRNIERSRSMEIKNDKP